MARLELDKPVSDYLAEWKSRTDPTPITVRQLLAHTSGLPFCSPEELDHPGGAARFAGSKFAHWRDTADDCVYDFIDLCSAIEGYSRVKLVTPPGEGWLYSNAGINTAGRVIEAISGEPFDKFVDSRLLQPLGMPDTTLWPSAEQLSRLATCYQNTEDGRLLPIGFPALTPPYSDRSRAVAPSGGYFSTARDFGQFARMLLRGGELDGRRYLSEAAVAEMTSKQTGKGIVDAYGLGVQLDHFDQMDCAPVRPARPTRTTPDNAPVGQPSTLRGGPSQGGGGGYGHGGAAGTELWVHPAAGRCTVLMVHQDGGVTADGGALRRAVKAAGKVLHAPLL